MSIDSVAGKDTKFCLFLDFDGVLFDTVKESYAVCLSMLNKDLDIEDISL